MMVVRQSPLGRLRRNARRAQILSTTVLVALATCPSSSLAVEPVLLLDAQGAQSIDGSHLEYLEDTTARWTIEQISDPASSRRFVAGVRGVPNFGFTASAYWVRFRLQTRAAEPTDWLVELSYPMMDSLELYRVAPDGTYTVSRTGDRRPFREREIEHRNFVFRIRLGAEESATFYLRSQTHGVTRFPLTVWSPAAFSANALNDAFFRALSYGPLIGSLLFLFVLGAALRDRSHLSLAFGLVFVAMGLMCTDGTAYQYLWPWTPWWANHALVTAIGFGVLLLISFCRGFLDCRRHSPRMDRYLQAQMVIASGVVVLGLAAPYALGIRVGVGLILVAAASAPVLIFMRWRSGYRPAGYLLTAACLIVSGFLALVLAFLGLLPVNVITQAFGPMAIAVAPVFFAVAVAHSFAAMAREKEHAETVSRASARLSRYFPRKTVERILSTNESVELTTQRRSVTIVFSDLVGFTAFSDRVAPERVSRTLNEYLGEMVQLVEAHGGTLNKFMGDGILVLFGAAEDMPEQEQARRAVNMAVAMQMRLGELAKRWSRQGLDQDFKARMGIHQDYVTVGNFGSAELMDYTAIGGGVNLASRLEKACPPGRIVVSYPVYSLTQSEFGYAPLREQMFKGLPHPMKVSELDPEPSDRPAATTRTQPGERVARLDVAKRRRGRP